MTRKIFRGKFSTQGFDYVLAFVKREGWATVAAILRERMRRRARNVKTRQRWIDTHREEYLVQQRVYNKTKRPPRRDRE